MMSALALRLAVAAAAALTAPTWTLSVSPARAAADAPPAVAASELEAAAAAVNRNRGRCAPLEWDAAAARAAQAHSDDMARRRYFAHDSPEGRGVTHRLSREGVAYAAAAENLGMGYRTGDEAVRGWLNSPGHRRNMQWCAVTRMGLGVRDGYWTLVMYAPRR